MDSLPAKVCSVAGCLKRHKAHGLCNFHYQRKRKGLPLGGPSRKSKDLNERLWDKAKLEPLTGCLEWQGARKKDRNGQPNYGYLTWEGEEILAHRLAYLMSTGPIPDGMKVCHSCDNPPCINPKHLWLGTQADNIADMVAKGRVSQGDSHVWSRNLNRVRGEATGSAKLTEAQVIQIRELSLTGNYASGDLAERFGVSRGLIYKIVSRKVWKHVL